MTAVLGKVRGVLRPGYPIETDRLLLRPFQPTDPDDFHAYRYLYGDQSPKGSAPASWPSSPRTTS
ncbi:hypothetical protein V1227_24410 [Lentzea sp. DG1S-22]|uniref:hypothetical protein n=1 Tax=Lentzea sp. DG1S-22 TaxID=3108822 RepID=UPI002E75D59F|nr:hypothetical protein [Lentzea sp. DG1S-22]WVH78224.1 hypothetical protein V1227_24410 [Lentzea sp. DG1S-22]